MNQILTDNEYMSKYNLNKNLKITKYAIIFLLMQCIILSSVLMYKIYYTNNNLKNNNDNEEIFMAYDNISTNEKISINEEIQNIEISESSLISLTSDSAVKMKVKQEETTVHKTSNGENYTVIAKLNIPKININMDVLSSTSNALLKVALNKYWGCNPNEVGNLCIVGHNYENGTHFSNLSKLNIGDMIKLTDNTGKTLTYIVYKTDIIDPYDTSCTSQLTNGEKEITLITCYNSGSQRFIVKARANQIIT